MSFIYVLPNLYVIQKWQICKAYIYQFSTYNYFHTFHAYNFIRMFWRILAWTCTELKRTLPDAIGKHYAIMHQKKNQKIIWSHFHIYHSLTVYSYTEKREGIRKWVVFLYWKKKLMLRVWSRNLEYFSKTSNLEKLRDKFFSCFCYAFSSSIAKNKTVGFMKSVR